MSQAPTPKRRTLSEKIKSTFLQDDWTVIRRVLGYAAPYRGEMVAALLIGLFAGLLTGINLVALIPVLQILFEEQGEDRVALVQQEVYKLEAKYENATGLRKLDAWVGLKKAEVNLSWKKWIAKVEEKAIYWMAGALLLAQILKSILEFVSKYILQKSFYLAIVRIRTDLYDRCLSLDLGHMNKLSSGDLISRLNNDIRAVRMVFTTMVSEAILAPFTVISLLVAMLILNWQLTLVVIVGLPFVILPIAYIGKWLRSQGKKDEEEDARLLDFTQETIQGLMIVKAFGAEQRELKKFRNLSRDMAHRQVQREKFRLLSEPFVEVTASIAMALILVVGGYIVLKSQSAGMSPTAFIVFLGMMTRFYPPLKRVSSTFVRLQKALASADRIFEVIDTEPKVMEKEGARQLGTFEKSISLENITFSYLPEKPPVFRDFSLEIPKGRKIALVGKAGVGKSTIVRLLLRLYDPEQGSILIDGVDIREVTFRSLRRQMAIVSQETILFNDTLFNNIRYGRPTATREEVIAAAEAAYAAEFIEKLPRGYETMIGERGGQLSGGQRQRVAIARALLADAPILLLDEATSSLDNESEAIVQAAIERLMENRTVLVIAHRLSTVRKADEIIVLHEGRIAERGCHETLIALGGRYADLLHRAELMDR